MIYTKPRKIPLKKKARAIPIRGKGADSGKWYKCWHCGFLCNIDRDDDSGYKAGVRHSTYIHPNGESGSISDRTIVLRQPFFYHVLMKSDAAGQPETIRHDFISSVVKGCPFCGTTNYRN